MRALVVGSDRLARRVLDGLSREGIAATTLAPTGSWLQTAPSKESHPPVAAVSDVVAALSRSDLSASDVLLAITDKDDLNLGAALAAREVNPRIRLVVRLFDVDLAPQVAALLPGATVLGLGAISAATFALAGRSPGVLWAHESDGGFLVLRAVPSREPAAGTVLAAARGNDVTWLGPGEPPPGDAGTLLVAARPSGIPLHAVRHAADEKAPLIEWEGRRLLLPAAVAFALVLAGATAWFRFRLGMPFLDALYFATTVLTTVGFGDFNLRSADEASKAVGIVAMLSGVLLSAVLFGLVVNYLLARQSAAEHGRKALKLRGHVVVCGLGGVGYRVAQALRRLGEPIAVIEADEESRFVRDARSAGIPVVIGSAADDRSHRLAATAHARSAVICTEKDSLNVEIALGLRAREKDLPIVLRAFDPDLSRRIAPLLGTGGAFSGAALAAPRFVAAAAGTDRIASLRFAGARFDVREVSLGPDETVAAAADRFAARPVALIRPGAALASPPDDTATGGPGAALLLVVPAAPSRTTGPS
jgi:voltage-gated potassium channel Kch